MTKKIESRIKARSDFEALLIDSEGVDRQVYMEALREEIDKEFPREREPERFDGRPVNLKRFGESVIGFGKHSGTKWKDIEQGYLEWLWDRGLEQFQYLKWRLFDDDGTEPEEESLGWVGDDEIPF